MVINFDNNLTLFRLRVISLNLDLRWWDGIERC